MDDKQNKQSGNGRGWHGDSEGHARAGRKGGKARSKKNRNESSMEEFESDLNE